MVIVALGAGCQREVPRSFIDFMEDPIARDGALARCNQDPNAALQDIECANARRAAAAVAVREEEARREKLARESARKLEALRERAAREQQAALEAQAAQAAAEQAEYEAQWGSPAEPFPFESDAPVFDVFGDADASFGLRELELAAVTPSAVDLHANGALELDRAAIVPRPFRETAEVIAQ